jgi:hypothetical protein
MPKKPSTPPQHAAQAAPDSTEPTQPPKQLDYSPMARIRRHLVSLGFAPDAKPLSYVVKPDDTIVFIAPDGRKFCAISVQPRNNQ